MRYTVRQLESMSETKLFALVLTDKSNRQQLIDELRDRAGTKSKLPTWFNDIIAEMKNGVGDEPKHERRETKPRRKRHSEPDREYWSSDSELANEPSFIGALIILHSNASQYWYNDKGKPKKSVEEIEGFLQDMIDQEAEYEDLTPGQQALLGVIRRKHAAWMRDSD